RSSSNSSIESLRVAVVSRKAALSCLDRLNVFNGVSRNREVDRSREPIQGDALEVSRLLRDRDGSRVAGYTNPAGLARAADRRRQYYPASAKECERHCYRWSRSPWGR